MKKVLMRMNDFFRSLVFFIMTLVSFAGLSVIATGLTWFAHVSAIIGDKDLISYKIVVIIWFIILIILGKDDLKECFNV